MTPIRLISDPLLGGELFVPPLLICNFYLLLLNIYSELVVGKCRKEIWCIYSKVTLVRQL